MKPGIKTGLWIFSAALPAVNGYLRVQAGKHFPTDVITGYIVGAATGWLVPQGQSLPEKTHRGWMSR